MLLTERYKGCCRRRFRQQQSDLCDIKETIDVGQGLLGSPLGGISSSAHSTINQIINKIFPQLYQPFNSDAFL
jgi:hypothetical protein